MNELAFERDYTALLTEAPQLQAALSAKLTERDSLALWNAKPSRFKGICTVMKPLSCRQLKICTPDYFWGAQIIAKQLKSA